MKNPELQEKPMTSTRPLAWAWVTSAVLSGLIAVGISSAPAVASEKARTQAFVRIEIGQGDEDADNVTFQQASPLSADAAEVLRYQRDENRKLRKRIRQLERAVNQLQEEFVLLRRHRLDASAKYYKVLARPNPRMEHTCLLKTALNGTFVARSDSRLQATAEVLQKCEQANAAFCNRRDVSCEESSAY